MKCGQGYVCYALVGAMGYGLISHYYFVTSLLMPPFLRYYSVYGSPRLPVTCQFRDINCLKEIV